MENHSIIIEEVFPVTIDRVWAALTDPMQMKQWYFNIPDFHAEPGFEFSFQGGTEKRQYVHLCRITEVRMREKLVHTWEYKGYEGKSVVSFELFHEGNNTRLRLTHSGVDSFPSDEPDFAVENFRKGWSEIIGKSLREFLEIDTIRKDIEINAHPSQVWPILIRPELIRQWGSAFSEGTYAESSWTEGAEVKWFDGSGKLGARGIITKIIPERVLKIAYYKDPEITTAEPGNYIETYTLEEIKGKTVLAIEAGPLPGKDIQQHDPLWDAALLKMKSVSEQDLKQVHAEN